jgi:RNA polymerase-binding protein DksA
MRSNTLEKYRHVLTAMRDRLTGAVDYVVESIQEDVNPSGNLSGAPVHLADVASEGIDADVHVLETERGMLAEIEAALQRLDTGQFGVCRQCNKPIAAARLDAIPYAARCIHCARAADSDADDANLAEDDESEGDELQAEVDRDAAVRVELEGESEPELETSAKGKRRSKPRRAGQRHDELLPGESTEGSGGDHMAAGTAGGGLAAGGLGGTNRGDGSADDADLENAMGAGLYDDTRADEVAEEFERGVGFEVESLDEPAESDRQSAERGSEEGPLEVPAAGSAGGAVGGTPANKRATLRTTPNAIDRSETGRDATIGPDPEQPR